MWGQHFSALGRGRPTNAVRSVVKRKAVGSNYESGQKKHGKGSRFAPPRWILTRGVANGLAFYTVPVDIQSRNRPETLEAETHDSVARRVPDSGSRVQKETKSHHAHYPSSPIHRDDRDFHSGNP